MKTSIAYLGIDAGKSFHVVCVKDNTKRSLIPSLTISDDEQGYQQLRHCLDTLKDKHGITLFAAGIESTATYHIKIMEYLRAFADIHMTLLNPLQTSHYLKSDMRRASTDKVSADIIALFMAEKNPATTIFLPSEYQTAKELVKRIHSLTKQKTVAINRLREHLARLWPEFERTYKDYNALQVLALLTLGQTPEHVKHLDLATHKKVTVGGIVYTLRSDFIANVSELAKNSQPRFSPSATEPIVKSLAEEALFLLKQIEQITVSLSALFVSQNSPNEKPLLSSIDGVGDLSAMVFTSAIGDVHRFSSVKQIHAYFGLNPRVKESGTSVHGRGYIQKKGNPLVRYYLFNCVLSMIRYKDHPIAIFYQRLCEKGKPKMVALVACMKKLLSIMFAMLKSNTSFSITWASNNI